MKLILIIITVVKYNKSKKIYENLKLIGNEQQTYVRVSKCNGI